MRDLWECIILLEDEAFDDPRVTLEQLKDRSVKIAQIHRKMSGEQYIKSIDVMSTAVMITRIK